MTIEALVIWLLIGAVAGWLAGQIMKGRSMGMPGDLIVGIIGALIGGWLLGTLGLQIGGGTVGAIINAVIGSCLLLFVLPMIKR